MCTVYNVQSRVLSVVGGVDTERWCRKYLVKKEKVGIIIQSWKRIKNEHLNEGKKRVIGVQSVVLWWVVLSTCFSIDKWYKSLSETIENN